MTTVEEKYDELMTELTIHSHKREELIEEQTMIWNRYHKTLDKVNELKGIGEDEAASKLEPELLELREKVEAIKEQISNMGQTGIERIKESVQNNPESKLRKLAEEIQKSILISISVLESKIGKSMDEELPEAKKRFLALVKQIGDSHRELYDLHFKLKKVEEVLPPDKHKSKMPRPAPEWSFFDIENDLIKVYGQRPYVSV